MRESRNREDRPVHELPRGTVTLLFTDIEGSTELQRRLGERYQEVVVQHRRLLERAFAEHRGVVVDRQTEAFFVVFERARDAVDAAAAAQRALVEHAWPEDARPKVRIGIHSGDPELADDRYVGLAVSRAARISSVAHGGQVLLSSATRALLSDHERSDLRSLGSYPLKDFSEPEPISQLTIDGLPSEFPPLRTAPRRSRRKPLVLVALALAVAGGVAAGFLLVDTGSSTASVVVNSVAEIDAKSNRVVRDVEVGVQPTEVVAGPEGVWVANAGDGTVQRVDERAGRVVGTLATPPEVTGLAEGFGSVWASAPHGETLYRIDTRQNHVSTTIRLRCSESAGFPRECEALRLAAGDDAIWAVGEDAALLSRIHTTREQVVSRELEGPGGYYGRIAFGLGALYIVSGGLELGAGSLVRIEPQLRSNGREATLPTRPSGVAVGFESVWVSVGNRLLRFEPELLTPRATIPLPSGAGGVAVGRNAVWVSGGRSGLVWRIDPETNTIAKEIALGGTTNGIAAWRDSVWVAVAE